MLPIIANNNTPLNGFTTINSNTFLLWSIEVKNTCSIEARKFYYQYLWGAIVISARSSIREFICW